MKATTVKRRDASSRLRNQKQAKAVHTVKKSRGIIRVSSQAAKRLAEGAKHSLF